MDMPINKNDVQKIIGSEINIAEESNNENLANVLKMILCEVAALKEYKYTTN